MKKLCLFALVFLFSLTIVYAVDPGQTSSLILQSGSINGQAVSASNRVVTVSPGAAITGTVTLNHNSQLPTNINTPLGVTRTWGGPETGFTGFGDAKGVGSKTVSFSYAAPAAPGTYYLIFAYRAEITYSNVFSMTNW